MLTAGGVTRKEIDPTTLASRLHPALYFAGEILDLDGPEGGWNLHWAFSSGVLAARSLTPLGNASPSAPHGPLSPPRME